MHMKAPKENDIHPLQEMWNNFTPEEKASWIRLEKNWGKLHKEHGVEMFFPKYGSGVTLTDPSEKTPEDQ
jgi:hypothetical protein